MDCFFKEVDMIEESDTEVIVTLIDRWEMVGKAIPNSPLQWVQAPGFRNIFFGFSDMCGLDRVKISDILSHLHQHTFLNTERPELLACPSLGRRERMTTELSAPPIIDDSRPQSRAQSSRDTNNQNQWSSQPDSSTDETGTSTPIDPLDPPPARPPHAHLEQSGDIPRPL